MLASYLPFKFFFLFFLGFLFDDDENSRAAAADDIDLPHSPVPLPPGDKMPEAGTSPAQPVMEDDEAAAPEGDQADAGQGDADQGMGGQADADPATGDQGDGDSTAGSPMLPGQEMTSDDSSEGATGPVMDGEAGGIGQGGDETVMDDTDSDLPMQEGQPTDPVATQQPDNTPTESYQPEAENNGPIDDLLAEDGLLDEIAGGVGLTSEAAYKDEGLLGDLLAEDGLVDEIAGGLGLTSEAAYKDEGLLGDLLAEDGLVDEIAGGLGLTSEAAYKDEGLLGDLLAEDDLLGGVAVAAEFDLSVLFPEADATETCQATETEILPDLNVMFGLDVLFSADQSAPYEDCDEDDEDSLLFLF